MNTQTSSTPWHLWAVGLVTLLWHAGGAFDYAMTQTRNMDYLQMAADEADVPLAVILEYFTDWPVWADAAWAFGVWGAVAGSLLLLLRSRFALPAFYVSIAGLALTTVHTLTSDLPDALNTPSMWGFSAIVVIVLLAVIYYSKRMIAAGVLR
ncbi:hypothetical protein [Aurantiacibacter marinus]|uniref:DoxX family protein n=1 Tax=Aurantiacibacter marinus TaxID=874156 RepID=A0A0H0XQG7_9SPHN|nr:hypothetical protein [Aurantiacibacter marinus]KLI64192.1 hypothetical protein AAV99_00485 [Aurantiacibacter marinus]